MKSTLVLFLSLLAACGASAADKCTFVLHPLTETESKWISANNKRDRLVSDFFDVITTFQSGRSNVREELMNSKLLSVFAELKNTKSKEVEVREGNAEDFKDIHRGEIPTESATGRKFQVTYLRRGDVSLFIYKISDPFNDTFTIRMLRLNGKVWKEEGGLEVKAPNAMIARGMIEFGPGIKTVIAMQSFFGSSERAVIDTLDILQLASGRDFSSLKKAAVPMVTKSYLAGAGHITAMKFRQKLMGLIQATIQRGKPFSKMLGDDNQTFAIQTGAELQKNADYFKYSFIKNLNPRHEYFVSEDTGAVRLSTVDLTLGRATGEIKMIRQYYKDLPVVLHIDGMDRPIGEIEYLDDSIIHIVTMHRDFFQK